MGRNYLRPQGSAGRPDLTVTAEVGVDVPSAMMKLISKVHASSLTIRATVQGAVERLEIKSVIIMHDSELSTSGPHVTVGSTSTEISNNMMLCDTGRRRNGLEHESDLDNAWKSHGDQNDGHLTNLGILRYLVTSCVSNLRLACRCQGSSIIWPFYLLVLEEESS